MAEKVDAAFVESKMKEGVPVLNVLERDKYEAMHIPGSYSAPVEGPAFDEAVQRLAPDKEKPIIVHCTSLTCQASPKAAAKLEALGYKRVYDYKAGIQDWQGLGKPIEGTARPSEAAQDKGVERPGRPARGQTREHEQWEASPMPRSEKVPPPV